MSTNVTILLSALILGGAIVAATVILSKDPAPQPSPELDPPDGSSGSDSVDATTPGLRVASTDERVAGLERELRAARKEIERLKAGAAENPEATPTTRTEEETKRVRDRFLELSDLYAAGTADREQVMELLTLAKDRALMERVVAELEAHIDAEPGDLDARMQLAEVQSAQIHSAESITERSLLARGISEQLGAILERDPEHWDARYMRAVGISHSQRTPEGRARAIEAFESLIALQQSRAAEPRFASTYAQLAEVHLSERSRDKALAAIDAGLARYPDDETLLNLRASTQEGK